ncbi:AzlC family ABC transporter permease [Acinetobacter qingfengensis]|uniref:Branched-chain amino acid ABC transporter permease n=1 Tax=Acinetobacter qingfengensis TaxID=1262585 RepID=A0A1E7R5H6_9GAMM|nr:AzlC family ABC transporter permease [Acinetobacter qingfengensis]KAA8733167.1 AzlC family ABC transporter permease [Acinetobacter qingfengensis]OEY94556.1 branched-chain amino acid ABC transporter permease [Acinetobacter qingfengensis]
MSKNHQELSQLNSALVWQGFKRFLPISFFVAIFGAAFGLAAIQTGLDPLSIVSMSSFVFAGAAQFAVLELWGTSIPIIPLIVTTFFINARHILMGASLYPWLKYLPAPKRYGILLVLSDANWAFSQQEFQQQKPGFGILFGGGVALWIFWVIGTSLGVLFGNVIKNPAQFGLDMVMACFLLSMVIGGEKNLRIFFIWSVAAISSLLAYKYLPENSHVVVGALAGGIIGMVLKEKRI